MGLARNRDGGPEFGDRGGDEGIAPLHESGVHLLNCLDPGLHRQPRPAGEGARSCRHRGLDVRGPSVCGGPDDHLGRRVLDLNGGRPDGFAPLTPDVDGGSGPVGRHLADDGVAACRGRLPEALGHDRAEESA